MSTYILTSMFPNGFNAEQCELFRTLLTERRKFAFIACEFEKMHEKTEKYFQFFLKMFRESGISFDEAYVVDGRMTVAEAQKALTEADVVWLSGGNTPVEFAYMKKIRIGYNLETARGCGDRDECWLHQHGKKRHLYLGLRTCEAGDLRRIRVCGFLGGAALCAGETF